MALKDYADSEVKNFARFDATRVFNPDGRDRFAQTLARIAIVSIASEFEHFINSFWNRVRSDSTFRGHSKTELFDASSLQLLLTSMLATRNVKHISHRLYPSEMSELLARFTATYVAHLVALQRYFREMRNSVVHTNSVAGGRLEAAAHDLKRLNVESSSYWKRHQFDLVYYSRGSQLSVGPRLAIAALHYMNEFVEMLASHFVNSGLGELMFDQQLVEVIDTAAKLVTRGKSLRNLTDRYLLGRIHVAANVNVMAPIPKTREGDALRGRLLEQLRVKLAQARS